MGCHLDPISFHDYQAQAMRTVTLGKSSLKCSRLAYGCWRIADPRTSSEASADIRERGRNAILAAFEAGYTLFDHADIYGGGVPEEIFGQVLGMVSGMRERVLIATKCGIRFANEPAGATFRYDFSADHIRRSCEGSLKRLGIETIDLYQLHRPDLLMNPEEVAAVFSELKQAGKVREFGVSNFRPSQLSVLQTACPMRLLVNQVEISLANRTCFEDGTLDLCLIKGLTPLAWSPLAGGMLSGAPGRILPHQEAYTPGPIIAALDKVAQARETTRTVIALAWLMKHPSGIVPIVGSTDPARIREAVKADETELTREEWYFLLEAARGSRLP